MPRFFCHKSYRTPYNHTHIGHRSFDIKEEVWAYLSCCLWQKCFKREFMSLLGTFPKSETFSMFKVENHCIHKWLPERTYVPTYPWRASLTNYTKYDVQCHQFELSCPLLIVNRGIVSQTPNVNPTLFVITCIFLGDYRIPVLQLLSLTHWFFNLISITHNNIPLQVADKRR